MFSSTAAPLVTPPTHPDLYIPLMALWTYCLLVGAALLAGRTFRPEVIYNTVSLPA